jgi:hypothetical protein
MDDELAPEVDADEAAAIADRNLADTLAVAEAARQAEAAANAPAVEAEAEVPAE